MSLSSSAAPSYNLCTPKAVARWILSAGPEFDTIWTSILGLTDMPFSCWALFNLSWVTIFRTGPQQIILDANRKDMTLWITNEGRIVKYSTRRVWFDLSEKDDEVIWKGLVWLVEVTWWNASHDDAYTTTYFLPLCEDVAAVRIGN
ncbi:hypothetical protein Tco_1006678 [Tanacetum coccineum]|uniref:Uncharacterized protein n=1 Tax=Tanacetum coccineum TaxID=301880 RepID=A0ABQ5FIM0_9ASTR